MTKALFPDVVVNGEVIPQAAIAAEAQNHAAPRGKPGLAWRAAANALAIRALLLQEAARQGLTPDPARVGEGLRESDEEALIRQVLEGAAQPAPPDEAAIRAEWVRHPARFRSPPLWEVSHILCACDPDKADSRAAALRRAKDLTDRALHDPAGFARLAASDSDCGSKSSGGVLGQLGPGDTVPEFEAALRQLSDGEITPEPVLSRHGYHVIRMDAVAPGKPLPFAAVRQKISDAMEKAAWARAAQALVRRLIREAEVTGAELTS